jgi:hypothetical protein
MLVGLVNTPDALLMFRIISELFVSLIFLVDIQGWRYISHSNVPILGCVVRAFSLQMLDTSSACCATVASELSCRHLEILLEVSVSHWLQLLLDEWPFGIVDSSISRAGSWRIRAALNLGLRALLGIAHPPLAHINLFPSSPTLLAYQSRKCPSGTLRQQNVPPISEPR